MKLDKSSLGMCLIGEVIPYAYNNMLSSILDVFYSSIGRCLGFVNTGDDSMISADKSRHNIST